jgi:hypothetical protein
MKHTIALLDSRLRLAALMLGLAFNSFGQSGATGTIIGTVSDSSFYLVPGDLLTSRRS